MDEIPDFFINQPSTSTKSKNILRPIRVGECQDEHFATPRRAKYCFNLAKNKVYEYKKRLAYSQKKCRRLQKRNETLHDIIKGLQDKNLLSENAAETLLV